MQAGYRSRYGHPAPEVVERWRAAGARIERTDQSGWLRWELGAGPLRLLRWREAARRYWHDPPAVPAMPREAEPDAADEMPTPEDPGLPLP